MYLKTILIVSLCSSFVEPDRYSILKHLGEYISEDNADMIKCARAIAERHFRHRQNVEIVSPKILSNDFEDFAIVVKNTDGLRCRYPDQITMHAIIFLEIINRQVDLKPLNVMERYHPQGRFVVCVRSPDVDEKREYLKLIIEYLASMKRWKVAILAETGGKVRVYGYTMRPKISTNCTRAPKISERVIYCDNESDLTSDKLYPVYFNFNKCPINLVTVHYPPFNVIYDDNGKKRLRGIEADAAVLILKKFNASFELTREYNGNRLRNMIRNEEADISLGYMYQSPDPGNTWTHSVFFVHILIVIPQSHLMPMWMNLILPYQTGVEYIGSGVWVTLGSTISIKTLIKLLIPSVRKKFHIEWMLLGFFGIGISKLPKRVSQRLYTLTWLSAGYVVMQGYSSSLIGFFASPGQYKPIQNLEELEKSDIVIAGLQNMKDQLSITYPRIARDFKVLSQLEYLLNVEKLIARKGGLATYAPKIHVNNITRGQESEFMVIPHEMNVFPIAMLFKNSSAILEGSDRVLVHVVEAGLVRLWERSINGKISQRGKTKIDRSLVFDKLSAAFSFLLMGYCMSAVVFFLELVTARLSHKSIFTTDN